MFYYPCSNCIELDILVKRFVLKKYKLILIYRKKINFQKNIYLENFNFNFFVLLRDLFTYLKSRNNIYPKIKESKNKFNKSKILIISHNKSSGYEGAYLNLGKKLSQYFNGSKYSTKVILPFELGLSLSDKLKSIFSLAKLILSKVSLKYFLKLSDIHFIILEFYRNIFKHKLKDFLMNKNFKFIISAYIDSRYEPIYYEAAKELKIKYFIYDYSLGYPIMDKTYMRYLLDTRKFCDVIFSNSEFRTEQYQNSINFLDKKPLICPHVSPQYDYSINKKYKSKLILKSLQIGIVDNLFADDLLINYEDIHSLVKCLVNKNRNLKFILQSKRGYLEQEFRKFHLKRKNYISCKKGDFSLLKNADLILSIGWQSVALMSAFGFNKPLLFYSKLGYPYENHFFSFDIKKNNRMNKYCRKIWMNENNINKEFDKLLSDQDYLRIIQKSSSRLLEDISFYDKKIDSYFRTYFKY